MSYQYHRKRSSAIVVVRLLVTGLLLLCVPVALEVFARLLAHSTGLAEVLEKNEPVQSAIEEAYRLQLGHSNSTTAGDINLTSPREKENHLIAVPSSFMGFTLLPSQQSEYWAINSSGFRDDDNLPINKPREEIRIAIVGGSVAFGQLSSNNSSTIAEQLETQLNARVSDQRDNPDRYQPDMLPFFADRVSAVLSLPQRIREGNYRAINAGVPGYASGNDLARLTQQVAAYDPEILLVLNGFDDLFLPSDRLGLDAAQIGGSESPAGQGFLSAIREAAINWFGNLMLVRGFQYYVLDPVAETPANPAPQPLNLLVPKQQWAQGIPKEDAEWQQRLDRYRRNLLQMVRFSAGAERKVLLAVAPDITVRDSDDISPPEAAILKEVGQAYQQQMSQSFPRLAEIARQVAAQSEYAEAIDVSKALSTAEGQIFQTSTDFTDRGNSQLASLLYEHISTQLVVLPAPFDPNRSDAQ